MSPTSSSSSRRYLSRGERALSVFYLIPVLVLFVVGEKYSVRVTIGGVKG